MGFVLFIHVVVCILLVISILMQAGRGGGLAESFASAESMFGTQTNVFMVRVTSVLAAVFLVTSLVLAFHASRKENSLMANNKFLPKVQQPKAGDLKIEPVKIEPFKAAETPAPAKDEQPKAVPAHASKP